MLSKKGFNSANDMNQYRQYNFQAQKQQSQPLKQNMGFSGVIKPSGEEVLSEATRKAFNREYNKIAGVLIVLAGIFSAAISPVVESCSRKVKSMAADAALGHELRKTVRACADKMDMNAMAGLQRSTGDIIITCPGREVATVVAKSPCTDQAIVSVNSGKKEARYCACEAK